MDGKTNMSVKIICPYVNDNEINQLKTLKYELKDSIKSIDSIYINLNKPKVREHADNLFNRFNIK